MADRELVVLVLRDIISTTWQGRFDVAELGEDVPLGEDGLGLDSVEVVEALLACEDRIGVDAGDALVKVSPLTIGRVADHLALLVV
jgi:acyl carrier protein